MRVHDRAFERLEAANPLTDTAQFEPTRADALAFLRSIEEETMDDQRLTNHPATPQRLAGRWLIVVIAFVAVFATGAALGFVAGGGESGPVASEPTTTDAPPVEVVVEEPAQTDPQ